MVGVNKNIDFYWLLKNTRQVEIWSNLLGYSIPTLRGKFTNPFRLDSKPDCYLWLNESGQLRLVDFADKNAGGDIINILKKEFNLSIPQIIEYLSDFIGKEKDYDNFSKIKAVISSTIKDFEDYDYKYWSSYKVSKEALQRLNIKKVKTLEINKRIFQISPHTYGYKFMSGNKKIYQPYNRNCKFIGNSDENDVYFEELLQEYNEVIYITSGFKDAVVVNSLQKYPAIAFNSERVIPSQSKLAEIVSKAGCIKVIYANDSTGLKYSEILTKSLNDIFPIAENITDKLNHKDIALCAKNNNYEILWNNI